MRPLERVRLEGGPRDRGLAHGERFADEIRANVGTYLDRFAHHGADEGTVREQAERFLDLLEDAAPRYVTELEAIAAGADVPVLDVTLLNVRYEVIYSVWTDEALDAAAETGTDRTAAAEATTDGCTSFGLLPSATADGHTYVGQNWDWLAPIAETVFLMDVRPETGAAHLAMTEAGIVGGKVGVNEHGIGLAVNGLNAPGDGEEPFRLPFHVRCRRLLEADRFDDALRPFLKTDRACSANLVVGHADGELIDLETAPEEVTYRYPEDGILTHANHFEGDIESLAERTGPSTLYRARRLRRHLEGADGGVAVADITAGLRDHFGRPASVCSHVDESLPEVEHGRTDASFVIDLPERRVLATRGPPCESEYTAYRLDAGA